MTAKDAEGWARDVTGKVAWITGAGTGIGEATAQVLADAGMAVVLSGRRTAPLETLALSLSDAGARVEVRPLDVVDQQAVFAAAQDIVGRFGRIDVLFGNAGINLTPRNWKDATDDPQILKEWASVLDINVQGVWNGIAAVLPTMRAQGDGLIVTTSSMAGVNYSKVAGVPYGASKHAVMSLSAHVNSEEGNNGIRATAICPGEVATPILEKRPIPVPPEDVARLIQPRDIAEVVLMLARMPARTRLNEILVTPTHTRSALQ
jgi:NADP-dependent 3-hydroxy acid dehydrogenase YdfG